MDFMKALANPYVLGAGALIGVFVMMRGGGSTPSGGNDNTGLVVAADLNRVGMQLASADYAETIDLAKTRAAGSVQLNLGALNALTRMSEVASQSRAQETAVRGAIWNSAIVTNNAAVIDRQQNQARLGMSYQETTRTRLTTDAQVKVSQIQAKAAKSIAQSNMWSSIVGDVAGAAARVAVGV